jgi:DNA-binding response OmpR family regulator
LGPLNHHPAVPGRILRRLHHAFTHPPGFGNPALLSSTDHVLPIERRGGAPGSEDGPMSALAEHVYSASMRPRFLMVVADPQLSAGRALTAELAKYYVDAEVCADLADALLAAGILRPDAVLLGAEEGLDRTAVVAALRKRAGIPVVVGIGANDGATAAAALTAGATACVARPYRIAELVPILRAIRPETVGTMEPALECGRLRLDPATMEVRFDGQRIALPLREYQVLRFLMTHADRVITRDQIYQAVWGASQAEASNTLTVHIKRLRHRLGDNQRNPHIIVTIRAVGYRLIPPVPARR